jgi:hypothetical protein
MGWEVKYYEKESEAKIKQKRIGQGKFVNKIQCCGSGFPGVPGSKSRFAIPIQIGSRRAKMTHKHRKKFINFIF